MSTPPGTLRFDGVTKVYRRPDRAGSEHVALDHLDVDVHPGESLGLIGPNGAGKSTALRIAAGITTPTSGTVRRRGETVAVIELGAGMHPDLTGRENASMLLALRGDRPRSGGDAAEVEAIGRFAELGADLDRPVRHYSSGMVARLAFAVATHRAPDILLLDEVMSVGDLAFQQRCIERIFEVRARGTTVVLVSHDLELIRSCCERAMLLSDGVTLSDGTSDDVIARYLGRSVDPTATGTSLDLVSDMASATDPLVARIDVPGDGRPGAIRVEVTVRTGSAARTGGIARSALAGVHTIERPAPGPQRLVVPVDHLPPGRHDLRVVYEEFAERHEPSRAPFTVLGAPGPLAVRLDATLVLHPEESDRPGEP